MTSTVLLVEVASGEQLATAAGRTQIWSLNRPRYRNALNPELVTALRDALVSAERDGVQVVVLRGEGPSFCAGADLRFLQSHDPTRGHTPRAFLSEIWDLTMAMEHSAIVFVAALHGHAVAGGLELALACDIVLAASDTQIGDGHAANNLLPGGGASARMERTLGRGTSSWLALTGALIPAQDPCFATWLRTVVPIDDLEQRTADAVARLLTVPDTARTGYKALLSQVTEPATEADKVRELDAFDRHWIDQNVPEALRLFLSKNRKATP